MFRSGGSPTRVTFLASCPILSLPPVQKEICKKLIFLFGGGEDGAVSISTKCITSGFLHAIGITKTSSPKGRLDMWQTWGLGLGKPDILAFSLYQIYQVYQ